MPAFEAKDAVKNEVQVEIRPVDLATKEEIDSLGLNITDDPSLNPWTFRMFFIGV